MRRPWLILSWTLQTIAALSLYYTAMQRIQGHAASVALFEQLHLGRFGLYTAGVTEAIVATCLLVPGLVWAGALMGLSLLLGALFFHGAIIGVEVGGDGGQMFYLALVAAICCATVLYVRLSVMLPGFLPVPAGLHTEHMAQVLRRRKRIRSRR